MKSADIWSAADRLEPKRGDGGSQSAGAEAKEDRGK